ncbi:MAG: FixH family protein [Spirosomataceae bacterium]
MKISWGTGIWAFYGLFVLMILGMVGMSLVQKIDLVTDNYYEEELRYQDKIDKVANTQQLATPLEWKTTAQGIKIVYPNDLKGISGIVYFYCPADNSKDFKVNIQPDGTNSQFISTQKAAKGRYKMQIDWQANDKGYWNEGQSIFKLCFTLLFL